MASTAAASCSFTTTTSIFTLGMNSTVYSLPAVGFSVPFLPAVALDLNDGQPVNALFQKGGFYFVELERFDDCFNFFHG